MLRILSYTVYEEKGSNRLHYYAFGDHQNEFESEIQISQWKIYLEGKFSKMFDQPVKVYVTRRSKPENEVDFMKVVEAAAKVYGMEKEEILHEKRTRKYSDARKVVCKILMDLDYTPYDIEKVLPWKDRVIYDYRKKINDRIKFEPAFKKYYEDISKQILNEVFGITSKN